MAKDYHSDFEKLALIHQHRINKSQETLAVGASRLDKLKSTHQSTEESLNNIDSLLDEVDSLLAIQNVSGAIDNDSALFNLVEELQETPSLQDVKTFEYEELELLDYSDTDSIDEFFEKNFIYAEKNNIDLTQRLTSILSYEELHDLNKQIEEEFTYKTANCDKYDYMIAGTVGCLGGLIDVFLVGAPKEGILTKWSDEVTNSAVRGFAKLCGWKGANEGSDPTKSAIGFLERMFKVNYDQRHSGDVNHLFKMSPSNHHYKSLAHHPDLIGLFFSLLDQFTNTAHFIDNGKIITIDTENFELSGSNFISKIFAGFINWLGHLFSDVAGSSGSQDRGSGIPIPFSSLLQGLHFGSFGQDRQTFAQISVQVFEKGYDLRHGIAMSIPVLIIELLMRVMYMFKRAFFHKEKLSVTLAFSPAPELRRMLLVGYSVFCLIDVGDATITFGGNWAIFFSKLNLIAWVKFGLLAVKEVNSFIRKGHIDCELLDNHIEQEYKRMLSTV